MEISLLLSLSWRNIWRNHRRTTITIVAVTVGVWSMIVLAAIMNAWAQSAFDATVKTLVGHGQIHQKDYLRNPAVQHRFALDNAALKRLLNSNQVAAWSTRVRVSAIVQSERKARPVTLVGIVPDTEKKLSFIGNAVHKGHYFNNDNEDGVLLGRKMVKRLKTGLGKRVVLTTEGSDGGIAERGFRIVGIFDAEQDQTETQFAFITQRRAQSLLHIGNDISEISFLMHDVKQLDPFLQRLHQVAPGLDIVSWSQLNPFTKALLEVSDGTILLWTAIMFILVAFGIINTLLMAVYERMHEFGLLQALGMLPRRILSLVLLESLFLIGIGALLGFVTGIATVLTFHNGLDMGVLAKGAMMIGAGRILYPEINVPQAIYIVLFVWLMGTITSIYPAYRASRKVPVAIINRN